MAGVLVGGVFAAGCDTAPVESVQVSTLDGGRALVSSPDEPGVAGREPPKLVEDLRIGSLDGPCDAFGKLYSLAVDQAGRIYAADQLTGEVKVFSPTGDCIRTFGGRGEGPGEFAMLAGVAWQPPGFLWAIDAMGSRMTVFDSLGVPLATHRVGDGRSAGLPWPMWVDGHGDLHHWDPGSRTITKFGTGPELVPLDSTSLPSLPRVAGNVSERWVREGVMVTYGIPHSPRIRFTVDRDGQVWLVTTSSFDLHETTYAGDTLRTVQLRRSPVPLEGRERDSIASARGIASNRLPNSKLLMERIHVAADGWIWVEPREKPTRAWDVFDERGYYLGPVVPPVPIETEPFPVFGAGSVTAVTEDELGVQYIVRLVLTR